MSDTRNLVSAVSWLSLGNMLSRMLAFLTMPLLTRWLSPEAYGAAALVNTVVSLASVVALAGIDIGYSRHFHSGRAGEPLEVEIFCWRWALGGALLGAAGGAALWWWKATELFSVERSLAVFVVIGVVTSTMATMAQTRARLLERYAVAARTQVAAGVASAAVALGIAYFWRRDAWALLFAMVAGSTMPLLVLGTPSLANVARRASITSDAARKVMHAGLAGLVTAPAYWVVSSADRWFLARYFDAAEVGVYSIGYTVGTVGMVVSAAITSAWLPELSRSEAMEGDVPGAQRAGQLSELLVAMLLIVWLAVVSAGGDIIRLLADSRFQMASGLVPWLAAGVLFYGVMHVGNAQLIMHGKFFWSGWIWVLALVVSLAFNTLLVPPLGGVGAAATQAMVFLLAMILVWLCVIGYGRARIRWRRLCLACVLAALAGTVMHLSWNSSPWVSLFLKLPLGGVAAASCLSVLAPELVQKVVGRLLRSRSR